ncbi:hypothetical protein SNEBB_007413 [Seison nebaliae]|nr:hypothetical protein SNEBB_007413 [Seison nebaliae]
MLVLVIGDLHIPYRSNNISDKLKDLLVPGKIQHILCTGNLTSMEIVQYLKILANDVHIVKGDMDDNIGFPEQKVVTIGEFRIGLCHGHQILPWNDEKALSVLQRQMNKVIDGKLIMNPGSATGAFDSMTKKVVPSFVVLNIEGKKVTSYFYRLIDDEVKVEQEVFEKYK